MRHLVRLLVPLAAGAVVLAGCGGDDDGGDADAGTALSADGAAGKSVFDAKGCASCHGTGIGPDLEGIYGTQVELEDGTSVRVDDAYLEQSITDPGAQRVAGFDVKMPSANVSDEEVRLLVAYIRELGGGGATDSTDGDAAP